MIQKLLNIFGRKKVPIIDANRIMSGSVLAIFNKRTHFWLGNCDFLALSFENCLFILCPWLQADNAVLNWWHRVANLFKMWSCSLNFWKRLFSFMCNRQVSVVSFVPCVLSVTLPGIMESAFVGHCYQGLPLHWELAPERDIKYRGHSVKTGWWCIAAGLSPSVRWPENSRWEPPSSTRSVQSKHPRTPWFDSPPPALTLPHLPLKPVLEG